MSGYSQFIYGKFYTWNSGYCLVACTPDLASYQEQLQAIAQKELRFWGKQPPEGERKASGISEIKHSVGAFTPKDHLVLIHTEEADRASGGTSYTQHRYIFVPKTEIINEPLLLGRLYKEKIPVFQKEFESNLEYFDPKLLEISKSEDWESEKIEEIVNSLMDIEEAGLPLLLASIAILLDNQQLILTFDDKQTSLPQKVLENILLLLPAACSNSLAVALGTIDETRCAWANFVIKANGFPNIKKLPENSIWLNRKSGKFSPQISNEIFQHPYIQDFLARIELNFDNIQRLQQHLQTLTSDELTLDSLRLPDTLIQIIPGLKPGKAQIECWAKYLPWASNIQSILDQDLDQPSLICLWKALEKRYDSESESVQTMLSLIQKLASDSVIEVLDHLFNHPKLAENLIDQGLLSILEESILNDSNVSLGIRKLCIKILENKSKLQKLNAAWDLAIKLIDERDIFPSNSMKLDVLDAVLYADDIPEIFLKTWFSNVAELFFKVSREEVGVIRNSIFFRKHLDKCLAHEGKDKFLSLLENPQENLTYLPYFVDAMAMNLAGADHVWFCCLSNLTNPDSEISLLLLMHELIPRSIDGDPNLRLNTAKFSKTFSWFKQSEKLCISLTQLEQKTATWAAWYEFANTYFYEKNLEALQYLDKFQSPDKSVQIIDYFLVNTLKQWMLLIDGNPQVEDFFLISNTYLKVKTETMQAFFVSCKKLEHVARLATYFIRSGQLHQIAGSLLSFLCQYWLGNKEAFSKDTALWSLLVSAQPNNAFESSDYLQLIHVKWHLRQPTVPDLCQVDLTDVDRTQACDHALALIRSFRDFQSGSEDFYWGQNLIQDCYSLRLDKANLKKIIINLIIETSPPKREIIRLLDHTKDWGLEREDEVEIIAKLIKTDYDDPLFVRYIKLTENLLS